MLDGVPSYSIEHYKIQNKETGKEIVRFKSIQPSRDEQLHHKWIDLLSTIKDENYLFQNLILKIIPIFY